DQPRRPRTRSAESADQPAAHDPVPEGGRQRQPNSASAQDPGSRQREAGSARAHDRGWEQSGKDEAPPWARPEDHSSVARPGAATSAGVAGSGDIPAKDDDNLEKSTTVGQPVIESVLGGKVIAIDDEPRR
ncbi:MAG: hypothetical protein WBG76_10230, partial [Ornithinimicrobium sp.]